MLDTTSWVTLRLAARLFFNTLAGWKHLEPPRRSACWALLGTEVIQPGQPASVAGARVVNESEDCPGGLRVSGPDDDTAAGIAWSLAAAGATIAALADVEDPFVRGQRAVPASSETIGETLEVKSQTRGLPLPGYPYEVAVDWTYTRTTRDSQESVHVEEPQTNEHIIGDVSVRLDQNSYRPGEPVAVAAWFAPREGVGCDAYYVRAIFRNRSTRGKPIVVVLRHADFSKRVSDLTFAGERGRCVYVGQLPSLPKSAACTSWDVSIVIQTVNDVLPDTPPMEAAKTIGGIPVSRNFQHGETTCTGEWTPNETFEVGG